MVPNLRYVIGKYGISKRVFERTRSKFRKMGIIDYVSRFSKAEEGWVLSSRFGNSLKLLSEKYDVLKNRNSSDRQKEKDYAQLNFV